MLALSIDRQHTHKGERNYYIEPESLQELHLWLAALKLYVVSMDDKLVKFLTDYEAQQQHHHQQQQQGARLQGHHRQNSNSSNRQLITTEPEE